MKPNKPFAEIIESSLATWKAQCWSWDTFPAFGSLVVVERNTISHIGVVCGIETGALEQGRYPFTYQKTEEELMAEQPQIFEFLKTSFSCLTLGYTAGHTVYHQLAPEPPKIHSFVSPAPADLVNRFLASPAYLHLLFAAQGSCNLDELILALVRYKAEHAPYTAQTLEKFID